MVYCFLFSLFCFSASLFADSCQEHSFSKKCIKNKNKPTPKIISEKFNGHFYAFGSYLYYIPNTDGLGYALTGINNTDTSNLNGIKRGKYLAPSQNPGSGFQAGAGGQVGFDKLIIEGTFSTWQDHNLSQNQDSGPCGSLLFNGIYYKDENNLALWNSQINTHTNPVTTVGIPSLTYTHVDWSQRVYLYDIAIKAEKLIGESFIIRPQAGILYASSKEFYNINYVFELLEHIADPQIKEAKICSSQKSHAIGPKIGLTSLYYPLERWALYGQFFCTPALNHFTLKTQECADLEDKINNIYEDVTIFNLCYKSYGITPIIELGLGFESNFNCFSSPSKVKIGFDQKYFFSHNYIKPPDFNSLYTPSNYSTQGLNVSIILSPFTQSFDEKENLDKTKTFLHPYYRRPTNRTGLSVECEILYPTPNVEGLAFAVNGINYFGADDFPEGVDNLHSICKGEVFNPVFSKEFAAKGTVNAHFKYADIDFTAEVFLLPHIQVNSPTINFSETKERETTLSQTQPLWFQDFSYNNVTELFAPIIQGEYVLASASYKYSLDLKKYNFFHGNTFQFKECLSLQTQFGLAFIKQKQSYLINYSYLDLQYIGGFLFDYKPQPIDINVTNTQTIKALGPSVRINSNFFLAQYFAFYGQLELAAPYGKVEVHSTANVSGTSIQDNSIISTKYWDIRNKIRQLFPCIIGEGGVKIMLRDRQSIHELYFALGYNVQAFLSNNFMQPVVNSDVGWDGGTDLSVGGYMNNSKGTLGLSGLTLSAGIKF